MTSDASGSIWSGRYLPVTLANLTVVAIASFDGLAIVAALPGITEDLGDVALLPWVITAYLATSAIAIIVAGPVIDAFGARVTFRVTGVWFLAWSAVAAAAPTMPLLVVARALQGLGGGLVIAVALAAVGLAYPHALRPSAFAANSIVWGLMGFGGPAVASALLTLGSWRLIFLVQLPLTALALVVGWKTLPAPAGATRRLRADGTGIALLTILTVASVVGVSAVADRWWLAAAGAGLAVVSGAMYWVHAGRADDPVLRREHLLRSPLRYVHITTGAILIAGLAADNYLPLYVQTTRGRGEGFAAFSLVFLTVGWTLGSIVFSRWLARRGEPLSIALGAVIAVPSLTVAAVAIGFDWPLAIIFVAFGFVGLSIGLVSTAGLTLLQAGSDPSEMGRVNAANQFVRTLAITVGIAAGGAILLAIVERRVGDIGVVRDVLAGDEVEVGADAASAIGDGLAVTAVFAVLVAIGCVVAAWRLLRSDRPTPSNA